MGKIYDILGLIKIERTMEESTLFTHIVLFKLTNPDQEVLRKTKEVLLGMIHKIPVLLELDIGIDELRSERSYDISLVAKLATSADLPTYQTHPAHLEVITYMKTVVQSSVTVDYDQEVQHISL